MTILLFFQENYLRETTNRIMADIELGKLMDNSIEAQIQKAELEGVEEDKINFVREEILSHLDKE